MRLPRMEQGEQGLRSSMKGSIADMSEARVPAGWTRWIKHTSADGQGARHGVSPCDVVLRYRSACNHNSCGILYLHLSQQDVAILCQLDVCKVAMTHIDGAPYQRWEHGEEIVSIASLLMNDSTECT